jgi:hypothetical protein
MNPLIQLKTTPPLLISLTLFCFALLPKAHALVPPPDGGYSNFTTAEGQSALFSLTTGAVNTAVGWRSLFSNTTGSSNTGVGAGALILNTADNNTATGAAALLLNTSGELNTAVGTGAMVYNDTGTSNTSVGAFALHNNTTGDGNTANGASALVNNITGNHNTANGAFTLLSHTTGDGNTAIGDFALFGNSAGFANTAIGSSALSNSVGSGNTAIGNFAGNNLTTGDNNVCIANGGVADDAGVIRIGGLSINSTYISGISGQTVPGGAQVFVDANGKLGTSTSSARFKDEIKPMDKASEAILELKPVTFRYKQDLDPNGSRQFGLVAEDVERVNPDLVARDAHGKVYTVRYEAVNAMLLNEFLKDHRTVQEQKATIAQLTRDFQSSFAEQQKQIEALTANLRKVSAQIDMRRHASQMVLNDE